MTPLIDITGQKFNKLTALFFDERKNGHTYWMWQCDCGRKKSIEVYNVKHGIQKTCGECIKGLPKVDLTGQTFNGLTVISFDKIEKGRTFWVCECICGRSGSFRGDHLQSENTKSCNHPECTWVQIDITGNKYGKLTVVSFSRRDPEHNHMTLWNCVCECNPENIVEVSLGPLRTGNVISCGCEWHKEGNQSYKWTGTKHIPGSYWAAIRSNAKIRNIEIAVDIDFIEYLFVKQNKMCSLSGLPLTFKPGIQTASLDRIDSLGIYSEDNVTWVHKDINNVKNKYTLEYLWQMAGLVHDYSYWNEEQKNQTFYTAKMGNKYIKNGTCITDTYWNSLVRNAGSRGLPVEVTIQDAHILFEKQQGLCAITGIPLTPPVKTTFRPSGSLDRIDSSLGYISGNLEWIHKDINRMKNDYSLIYFIELCRLITIYRRNVLKAGMFC